MQCSIAVQYASGGFLLSSVALLQGFSSRVFEKRNEARRKLQISFLQFSRIRVP
jgi:hypothetical protein